MGCFRTMGGLVWTRVRSTVDSLPAVRAGQTTYALGGRLGHVPRTTVMANLPWMLGGSERWATERTRRRRHRLIRHVRRRTESVEHVLRCSLRVPFSLLDWIPRQDESSQVEGCYYVFGPLASLCLPVRVLSGCRVGRLAGPLIHCGGWVVSRWFGDSSPITCDTPKSGRTVVAGWW
jgi:hypothetical protein